MECVIREWKMSDAADLVNVINNKKVIDNLRDGIPFPYKEKDGEFYINSTLSSDKNKNFEFAITLKDKVIGSIAAFRQGNIHSLTAEVGYYIGEEFWGKGIMTSAIKQLSAHIFANTDIMRLYAEPFASNIGSCRALEKAGFELEGTLRKNAIKNGEVLDMKMYSLIRQK